MLVIVSTTFAVNSGNWKMKVQEEVGAFDQEMPQMTLNDFMELTPATYKEATGQRLGIKNTLKLKAAQKFLKKNLNSEHSRFCYLKPSLDERFLTYFTNPLVSTSTCRSNRTLDLAGQLF